MCVCVSLSSPSVPNFIIKYIFTFCKKYKMCLSKSKIIILLDVQEEEKSNQLVYTTPW